MALSVETGQFAANTGSATTTVSCGFTGKALILWTTGQTTNGSDTAANASWSIGFSDGTNNRSFVWGSDDNVATTNTGHGVSNLLSILSDGTPTFARSITGVSFGASSFDLTWNGTPASAYLVNYMLLGGTDITNVKVGTAADNFGSTGNKSETGPGFQGNFGMFLVHAGGGNIANTGIGFAVSNTKQFTASWGIDDGANMTTTIDAVSYTNNSGFVSYITEGAETVDLLASFTNWTSTGFDFNVSNASTATGLTVEYLVIAGGQWDVGTSTTPTSSGTRTISSMSFQPQGLFLAHTSTTADATVTIDCNSTVGAATSTSTEASCSASQDDAVLNTTCNRSTSNSKILLSGSFPTTSVDFTSFASNGWTITEGGVSATAYQMGWFACGSAEATVVGKKPFAALLAHRRFNYVP